MSKIETSKISLIGSEREPTTGQPRVLEFLISAGDKNFILRVATPLEIIRIIEENSSLPPDQRLNANVLPLPDISDPEVVKKRLVAMPERVNEFLEEIPTPPEKRSA